jgi:hypothetical protein
LRRSHEYGVFWLRLTNTAAGSGVCAGEFGEKRGIQAVGGVNHAAARTDKAAIAGGVSLMGVAGAQGLPNRGFGTASSVSPFMAQPVALCSSPCNLSLLLLYEMRIFVKPYLHNPHIHANSLPRYPLITFPVIHI